MLHSSAFCTILVEIGSVNQQHAVTPLACTPSQRSTGRADEYRKEKRVTTQETKRLLVQAMLMLSLLMVFSVIGWASSEADFGDLPDPGFPTLRESMSAFPYTGPYHLDVTHEWIGETPGGTTVEADAKPANEDEDNGYVKIQPLVSKGERIGLAEVAVPITTDGDESPRYLNIAVDLNEDGRFSAYYVGEEELIQQEWIAQNVPIAFRGETQIVTVRFEMIDPHALWEFPPTRVTLTTQPIYKEYFGSAGWDGSGPVAGFERGETEDFLEGDINPLLFDPEGESEGDQPPPPPPPTVDPEPRPPVPPIPPDDREGNDPTRKEEGDDKECQEVKRQVFLDDVVDIVQGQNECAPTSAADSVRWLLDKTGTAESIFQSWGMTSDDFNRWLLDTLIQAMNTDPEGGTTYAGILEGKQTFSEWLNRTYGHCLTTSEETLYPTCDELYEALRLGKDVEMVFFWDCGETSGAHSVTVVGVTTYCNGDCYITFLDHGAGWEWDPVLQQWVGDEEHATRVPPELTTVKLNPDGSMEGYADHASIYNIITEEFWDFGDAPHPRYATLLTNNGARHLVDGIHYLGVGIDGDCDGQPTSSADGDDGAIDLNDDEDGVVFDTLLIPGRRADITVTASTTGFLDAWLDFNSNGNWSDPGERIFRRLQLSGGVNRLSFLVPPSASANPSGTCARFRFSSTGGLASVGPAEDGEVEDYWVYIRELDFGDAPDPTYPTLSANNGAYHVIYDYYCLGKSGGIDGESDGQPTARADGDDRAGQDDGDGVTFSTDLVPGSTSQVVVEASQPGYLDAWMDYNQDGDWADPGEQIFASRSVAQGSNTLSFTVPSEAIPGETYARFRFSSTGGLAYTGWASDGEVEDYLVEIGQDPIYECIALLGKGSREEYIRDGTYQEVYNYYRTRKDDFLEDEVEIYRNSREVSIKYRQCGKDVYRYLIGLPRAKKRELAELFWAYFTGQLR